MEFDALLLRLFVASFANGEWDVRPQRTGFKEAKNDEVFDDAPENRDREADELAEVDGVLRPEVPKLVAFCKKSCIIDCDCADWEPVLVPAPSSVRFFDFPLFCDFLFGGTLRFRMSDIFIAVVVVDDEDWCGTLLDCEEELVDCEVPTAPALSEE